MRFLRLAGTLLAAAWSSPAAELTPAHPLGAEAGQSRATAVAWYRDRRGHCVQVRRPGYVFRPGWGPGCGPGWRWSGFRCVAFRPVRPAVVVRPGVTVRVR